MLAVSGKQILLVSGRMNTNELPRGDISGGRVSPVTLIMKDILQVKRGQGRGAGWQRASVAESCIIFALQRRGRAHRAPPFFLRVEFRSALQQQREDESHLDTVVLKKTKKQKVGKHLHNGRLSVNPTPPELLCINIPCLSRYVSLGDNTISSPLEMDVSCTYSDSGIALDNNRRGAFGIIPPPQVMGPSHTKSPHCTRR